MRTCIWLKWEQRIVKVSVAIMGHLRTFQYYYSKEAYRDFNFNPDTYHLIHYKPHKMKFKWQFNYEHL